ncbi:MAG: DMT family transporter [Rhodovibrionaceae bacterium]|nr:DMT family transporter [Rhodovibrionaceae bacterium]
MSPRDSSAAQAGGDRIALGIATMLGAMFFLSTMDATAKWLGASYPIVQVAFFRNFFALVPVMILVMHQGGLPALKPVRFGLHVLRAMLILAAIFLFFTGLRSLPLAEATAIAFAAPLFITAMSVPVLGEHVGFRRWAAVIVGFMGVLIIVRPGAATFQIEALLPLGAAASYGTVMLMTRLMARTETTAAIYFWSTAIPAAVAGVLLVFGWKTPAWADLPIFVLIGFLGGGATILLTFAYRYGPAAVIAPFDYSALIWATAIGWLVWRDFPDFWVCVGAMVLVASGIYIIHRETGQRRAAARTTARPPATPPS